MEKAWLAHCRLSGISPNNRPERERWYRDQVHSCTGYWSTRDVDPDRDYMTLLDRFMLLAGEPQPIIIFGWSDAQNRWFSRAAQEAWTAAFSNGCVEDGVDFLTWLNCILEENGILHHTSMDHEAAFDSVMGSLAVISNDDRMIAHFSEASERRMRWQIKRFMSDLEWLENRSVGWDYISAIWGQSELLPAIDEAPASTLQKVLQMLDTHIRRLCSRNGIRPKDLPSRR